MYFAQDNYPEAARLSEEVINEAEAAGYELESDYANIFTEQFNSKEMLFPYTANPNELMDASWFAFSRITPQKVADDLVPDDETGGDIVVPDPGEGGDVVVPDPGEGGDVVVVMAAKAVILPGDGDDGGIVLVVMVAISHSLQVKMMQLPTILFILGHTRVEA